ncbi:MAG: hypothetical protein AB1763_07650 [Campylobacterota bacterium]
MADKNSPFALRVIAKILLIVYYYYITMKNSIIFLINEIKK